MKSIIHTLLSNAKEINASYLPKSLVRFYLHPFLEYA